MKYATSAEQINLEKKISFSPSSFWGGMEHNDKRQDGEREGGGRQRLELNEN